MKKRIRGYCVVQDKYNCEITIDMIDATTKEDYAPKSVMGRVNCEFAAFNNDPRCDKCSVKENSGWV